MKISLEMGFKGNRTYLQGGDFFNALERVSAEFTEARSAYVARLVFRHLARHSCELSSLPPEATEVLIAQGKYRQQGGLEKDFWLLETNKQIADRRPYNEEVLFADAVLDNKERSALLIRQSSNTPIEDIVGLTKILNNKLMPIVQGKWLFAQIDLMAPLCNDHRNLAVRMKNSISGRFSISEIYLNGNMVGVIQFIVGQP